MRAATIVSGAISSTCSVDVLALVGEPPLKFDILGKIYKLGLKASYLYDSYICDIFRETWHQNYGNYTTRYTLLSDLYLPFAVTMQNYPRSVGASSELAPWQVQTPSFDVTLRSYGSKEENPNLLKSVADSIIQANEQHLAVFTDASKHTSGAVGVGIIIQLHTDAPVTLTLRLTDGISIYKAELFAIYYALLYISGPQMSSDESSDEETGNDLKKRVVGVASAAGVLNVDASY